MSHFTPLATDEHWQALKDSADPVILLKHSSTCGISLHAHSRVEEGLLSGEIDRDVHLLIIQESRPLSALITEESGVTHQSPQLIIMHKGKAIYDASHQAIMPDTIAKALATIVG